MATEKFVNNGQTRLAVACTAGATSLLVNDGSKLPTLTGGDQFHIVVFDPVDPDTAEIMLVTGRSGNTLTVERAREAIGGVQTAFPHGVGETVANELSVESLLLLISQNGGGGGGGGTRVEETPSGTINGSNDTFTLSNSPLSASLNLYLNGLRMRAGASNDYTITGTSITFDPDMIPQSGDSLIASYSY